MDWFGFIVFTFFLACDKENPKTELQSSEVNNLKIDHKLSDTKVHHNFFFMQDLNKSFDNFNKPLIIAFLFMRIHLHLIKMEEDTHIVPPGNSLDLHNFRVDEAEAVIVEFLWSCKKNGYRQGVIIHGKGSGYLREIVRLALKNNDCIVDQNLIDIQELANWGRTHFKFKT